MRALVSCWKLAMPTVAYDDVRPILDALASEHPQYVLPPASVGHARYFMPWGKKSAHDRALVFDTFVAVKRESELVAIWPDAQLDTEQRVLLSQLLTNLSYLGRAESWCKMELTEEALWPRPNCIPIQPNESIPDGHEPVRVLCPRPGLQGDGLIDSLTVDTGYMRGVKLLLDPTGSQWVTYARPRDCFEIRYYSGNLDDEGTLLATGPTLARYFLHANYKLPVTEALSVGELARKSAMAMYGRMNDGAKSPTLSGKDQHGTPLKGHQHAYYVASDEDGDGWLDHLTVFARTGFSLSEKEALARLRVLNPGGGRPELRLVLLGVSPVENFRLGVPWLGKSCVWQSCTPFMLVRHPKLRGNRSPKLDTNGRQIDGPEAQVRAEWNQFRTLNPDLPEIVAVERLPSLQCQNRNVSWLSFRRWRRRGKGPVLNVGYGFKLTFSAPVAGPILLGYGCHFGLGQFYPE